MLNDDFAGLKKDFQRDFTVIMPLGKSSNKCVLFREIEDNNRRIHSLLCSFTGVSPFLTGPRPGGFGHPKLPLPFSYFHTSCLYLRFLKSDCALCALRNLAQNKIRTKLNQSSLSGHSYDHACFYESSALGVPR